MHHILPQSSANHLPSSVVNSTTSAPMLHFPSTQAFPISDSSPRRPITDGQLCCGTPCLARRATSGAPVFTGLHWRCYGNWNCDSTGRIIQVKGKSRCATSKISCSATSAGLTEENVLLKEKSVSVILLAGGKGKRMAASMPKQYLPLLGQPIALYSLYTFSQMIEVKEIVVVCDPSYRDIFEDTRAKINVVLKFSKPGKERQDSVYSGLQAVDPTSELVCIHDSARPLVLSHDVQKVLRDGCLHGAAVLGVPVKATIKEANVAQFVVKTLDRKTLWEMQTPQVIRPALLKEGFNLVNSKGLEVTDDVSIVEHLKHPVYITEGSYTNIKITTPDDLLVAERILNPS